MVSFNTTYKILHRSNYINIRFVFIVIPQKQHRQEILRLRKIQGTLLLVQ